MGRYLRVVYVPDPEPESVFVVTAYELTGKPLAGVPPAAEEEGPMSDPKFPPGWDAERAKRMIEQYDQLSEDSWPPRTTRPRPNRRGRR